VLVGSPQTDNRGQQPTLPCEEDFRTKIKRGGWCVGAAAREKTRKTGDLRAAKMAAMLGQPWRGKVAGTLGVLVTHIQVFPGEPASTAQRADTAAEALLTRRAAVRFFLLQSQHPGRCPESKFPRDRFPGSKFPGSIFLETRFLGSCSPEPCGMPWI